MTICQKCGASWTGTAHVCAERHDSPVSDFKYNPQAGFASSRLTNMDAEILDELRVIRKLLEELVEVSKRDKYQDIWNEILARAGARYLNSIED